MSCESGPGLSLPCRPGVEWFSTRFSGATLGSAQLGPTFCSRPPQQFAAGRQVTRETPEGMPGGQGPAARERTPPMAQTAHRRKVDRNGGLGDPPQLPHRHRVFSANVGGQHL